MADRLLLRGGSVISMDPKVGDLPRPGKSPCAIARCGSRPERLSNGSTPTPPMSRAHESLAAAAVKLALPGAGPSSSRVCSARCDSSAPIITVPRAGTASVLAIGIWE